MQPPSLIIQTVCFDESDRQEAAKLGGHLYDLLTRPRQDSLAHGPGIPVYRAVQPDCIDLKAAQKMVILPVLGGETHAVMRTEVVQALQEWHQQLGDGHVIPVPMSPKWRAEESDVPGKNLLTQLYGEDDREQRTVDEIIIAILRLFDPTGAKGGLFISHAKKDLAVTQNAAEAIRNYVATDTTAQAFFDTNKLAAGISLKKQIEEAQQTGVFVAIRTDAYSSRDWCLHELLQAKRNGLPTLTVELLTSGEALSSPYAGNAPTLVWNPGENPQPGSNPQRVVSRALVECLRAAHFQAEKKRIVESTGLPDDTVGLCRPPELLDLIQGPLLRDRTQVVIHPDPEIPTAYRELLAAAHPRLRLVTPTTAFRSISGPAAAIANPFDGKQIGFSISNGPDVNGPRGFAKEHIDDVAVYLARSLIAAGAHLAYGGDFRKGGYTEVFSELISAYRQTAGSSNDILHSYVAAHETLEMSGDLLIKAHLLNRPPLSTEASLPSPKSPEGAAVPRALYFSDMRRVMTLHVSARIILGGASKPRIAEIGQEGFGGIYPGVVEEAWWSLRAGQPLYVIGGFGGGAGLVAGLLSGAETPAEMRDETWTRYESWKNSAQPVASSPFLKRLELPATMQEMAESIRALAASVMRDDNAAERWNGLSLAENRELWRSRDPLRIATLVYKGLRRFCRRQREGKVELELVEGTVTAAQGLQAIAVTVFEGLPLGGAGAALDRLAAGRASVAHASGQALVSMDSAEIAADFLYLASLGKFDDLSSLTDRIRSAASSTADCVLRHGFSRLGVVSFGGAMATDLAGAVDAMISGLEPIAGQAAVVWFENDPGRFASLLEILEKDPRVSLTTRRQLQPTGAVKPEQAELLMLSVTLKDDILTSTVMPPSGTGVARTRPIPFNKQALLNYSRGAAGRNTPPPDELARRGQELSKTLFGEDAADLISRCRKARTVLLHDVASSQLPFEILLANKGTDEMRPALDGGLNRRLAVSGISTDRLFAKPPHTGKLKVLVVINPLVDLKEAEREGENVLEILGKLPRVEPVPLRNKAATKSAFLEAIATADVLHYCGHAFFDGPGPEESGLNLYGDALFFTDLMRAPSALRIVFANACEAGRVRALPDAAHEAASFAEYLLRTGIEAFLGTYWRVADSAAGAFAQQVYASLARGDTLDAAVRTGRLHLREIGSPEWANYVLYGEGRFQIVNK
ncbi:MAG TPA: CHAT domain-containing protein [Verrucomicrobiota bacterium]|nr:CHAT domain-containing protein [Verrucomicrobiota bacterium]